MNEKKIYSSISNEILKKIYNKIEPSKKDNVKKIIDKVSQGIYYLILFDYNINILPENIVKYQTFPNLVSNLESNIIFEGFFSEFDIEMIKFGKGIFGTNQFRWAVINFPFGIFSSKSTYNNSSSLKQIMATCKDKTHIILKSSIIKQKKDKFDNQKEWYLDKKPFRLLFQSKVKIEKPLLLFFEKEDQMNKIYSLLLLLKINKTSSDVTNENFLRIRLIMEVSYIYYTMIKIKEIKKMILRKKTSLNLTKKLVIENFRKFEIFGKDSFDLIFKKFSNLKKLQNSRFFLKQPCFHKPKNIKISNLKKNVIKISNFLLERLKFRKENSENTPIFFKILKSDIIGQVSDFEFDLKKFKYSKKAFLNRKSVQINFENKNIFTIDKFLLIHNVFLNLNLEGKYEENCILINGPKVDSSLFFKYSFKKEFIKNDIIEKFIEPDYFGFCLNPTIYFNINVLQIFHSQISISTKRLEKINQHFNSHREYFQNDFYYFINILINNKFKARSYLVDHTKIINSSVYTEFNTQYYLEVNPYKSVTNTIKLTLFLIPKESFDEKLDEAGKNFLLDYLTAYEFGYCLIKPNRNEYDLITDSFDTNKIIVNFIENVKDNNFNKIYQYSNCFTIGYDINSEEEIDYSFIQSIKNKQNIHSHTVNSILNIKHDENFNLLLRPPKKWEYKFLRGSKLSEYVDDDEKLINFLQKEIRSSQSEINSFFENKNFSILPCIQVFDNNIHERPSSLDIKQLLNFGYKKGDVVTRIRSLKRHFVSKLLGVNESMGMCLKNYLFNEIKVVVMRNDIKQIVPIQENMFSIYDFNEIDLSTIENNKNYSWILMLKFETKKEMTAFLYFLTDFRRRANLNHKLNAKLYKNQIKLINPLSINKINLNLNTVKISISKIEFNSNFRPNRDYKIFINFHKGKQVSENGLYFIECMKDKYFSNSILNNKKEFLQYYSMYTSVKYDSKKYSEVIQLSWFKLNKIKSILKFKFDIKEYDNNISFDLRQFLDKTIRIEIKLISQNEDIEMLYADLNVESFFDKSNIAESVLLSIKSIKDKFSNIGIIYLNVFTEAKNDFSNFKNHFINNIETFSQNFREDYQNIFNPNVYRRKLISEIYKNYKLILRESNLKDREENFRNNLIIYLNKKNVKGVMDLMKNSSSTEWKELNIDIQKYLLESKRRIFYHHKRNLLINYTSKMEYIKYFSFLTKMEFTESHDIKKIFENFPDRKQLLFMKKYSSNEFSKIKSLIFLGLPNHVRIVTWQKILYSENLVNVTLEKLINKIEEPNEYYLFLKKLLNSPIDVKKKELYDLLNIKSKTKFLDVDLDLNYFKFYGGKKKDINFNELIQSVKKIAKSYLLWTELDIKSEKNRFNGETNKKFIYFIGLLQIIYSLNSVFKDDHEIFWIISSFSQYFEWFYHCNPLFENLSSYSNKYISIFKALLESKLPKINEKFKELNFPVEYFIHKSISTFFSEFFSTDLFLKILDIIIFEASLKTNNHDKFDYMKIHCVIQMTLFEMKEKSIIHTKSVNELDIILSNKIKSTNSEKFIQKLRINLEKFFDIKEFNFFNLIFNNNNFFDDEVKIISNQTEQTYLDIMNENISHLKQKIHLSINQFISSLHESLSKNHLLPSIKSMYCQNFETEQINEIGVPDRYDFIFVISSIFEMSKILDKVKKYKVTIDFNNDINNLSQDLLNFSVTVEDGNILIPKFYHYESKYLQNNMIIFIYENDSLLAAFYKDIMTLEYMKPYNFILESTNSQKVFYLNLTIIKIFKSSIKEEEGLLFDLLFSKSSSINFPQFFKLNDKDEMLEITNKITEANKYIHSTSNKLKEDSFLKKLLLTNAIISSREVKNTRSIKQLEIGINDIFKNYNSVYDWLGKLKEFEGENNYELQEINLIYNWLSKNSSSFEEIICGLIIVDEETFTVYDKLKLIFSLSSLQNSILLNKKEHITISKFKEIVFILYKRFMVNMTRFEIDRIIDYFIHKENLLSFRYFIFYNKKNENILISMINDEDTYISEDFNKKSGIYFNFTNLFIQKVIFLQNHFNIDYISPEILQIIVSNIPFKINNNFDQFLIQYEKDKIRITNHYHFNNKTKKIKRHKMINLDTLICDNPYKVLLKRQIEGYELNNNENQLIDFERFQELFYKLPFISDLLRAYLSHSIYPKVEFENAEVPCVKYELHSPRNNMIFTFVLSKDLVINF